jgi:hypothetical protein
MHALIAMKSVMAQDRLVGLDRLFSTSNVRFFASADEIGWPNDPNSADEATEFEAT